ncbi:hypothetical protein TMPK1_10750 [Rhodospirillales bacterium TMPK1]|uniref:Uncharacterized protein n=1 Tax=Roseiterribacter gracilis TaxID=2812848 RepID=A0A8S8X6J7_9PROT|nr:hypothetical protein TMPK1_10750 [Rhodospirillales bacterium TMPK1]
MLVLGVFHFAGSKGDLFSAKPIDLADARTRSDIDKLAAALRDYRPTKIFVETMPDSEWVTQRWPAYRAATIADAPRVNEIEQIGFRVAKDAGLDTVAGVNCKMPDGPESDGFDALLASAKANKQDDAIDALMRYGAASVKKIDAENEHSLLGALAAVNQPKEDRERLALDLQLARIGTPANPIGGRFNGAWYARNVCMYANVTRDAVKGDRILLVIGAGHAPLLRQMLRDDGRVSLVDPISYLKRAAATKP